MNTHLVSAFLGTRLIATGTIDEVAAAASRFPTAADGAVLFFEHATGRATDVAWGDVPKPGPGRPKLGVASAEVTLLPRHWDWLHAQPARASGTLRRLVEDAMARQASDPRQRWEALGKILWSVAGNEPDFEEASRALYAHDRERLVALTRSWSGDLPAFVEGWPLSRR